jgi:hypothetical protein
VDRCSLRQRGLVLREWILGWDRDRSTAVGIEQGDRALRPKASMRGIAAAASGAIFGLRALWASI